MASAPVVAILISPIPANERYRPCFKDLTYPIFLVGDSITGQLKFVVPKGESVGNRNIFIRLAGKFSTPESILHAFVVEELKLSLSGITSSEFSSTFAFDKPVIPFPSYHGIKCSLMYQIAVEVKSGFLRKSILKSETIVIFDPSPNRPAPKLCHLPVIVPPTSFGINFPSAHFSVDEQIKAQLEIRKSLTGVQSIAIRLILTERWGEGSQSRFEDTILLNYELIDGCPPPPVGIPFVIQLAPLQLWTAKCPPTSKITVSHRFDVIVRMRDDVKTAATHNITLTQPIIP
jgi:hypothetical protein